MCTHTHTQCPLLEVVVPQQVASPQHVVVREVGVQGASGVGPFPALSNLLGRVQETSESLNTPHWW